MIIGDGIVLGAGGETASIFVTGVSEADTVTASKDGKTVIGKWTQKPNPAYVVPDGYTQLEYIESTGTQYIDTNFTPNQDTRVVLDHVFTSSTLVSGFGARYGYNTNGFVYCAELNSDTSKSYVQYGAIYQSSANLDGFNRHTVDFNKNLFYQDGTQIYSFDISTFTVSLPILLFAYNDSTVPIISSGMRCYSSKIYDNGTLIRDFIPAKRNSDSVIGLYDIVNGVFYTNAGTGEFVAGPEVPQTIDGFLIKPIRDFGTWTVTATNGTNTATQDVLVDSATQYDIELSYKLWLYKDGDECENVTGGWVRTTTGDFYGYPFTGTVTFNADNIYIATLSGSSDEVRLPFANTVNTIDLTGYSTLKIEYENATVGHYQPDRMSRIYIASAVGVASMQGYFEKSLSFSGSGISELDITSLSGGKYVVLTTASDIEIHATITKVWLE